MKRDGGPTEEQVAAMDGAVAELVGEDTVEGWVASQAESFRNLFLAKQVGCWLLFTWPDGSIEIEEDYPPFALVPELLSGTFRDDENHRVFEVRWVTDHRRHALWERYGIHESPGYYMAIAAERRRGRQ